MEVVILDPGKKLLSPDTQQEEGIFIIEEGALEVCTVEKMEPVARLLKGDFCGEMTALFGGSSTAMVQCYLSGCVHVTSHNSVAYSLNVVQPNKMSIHFNSRYSQSLVRW